MISKNNVSFSKVNKKDYFIYIDKNTNRGIFTPYYKGTNNSFFYDFKISKCRIFHKNAKSYSILDLSLDGKKVMIISNDADELLNNKLRIVEIGTNKIFLELNYMYIYEAYFTGNPRYILCRGKDFNIINTFIYDIIDKKIVYILKENIFINNGCFYENRKYFIYPSTHEDNTINQLNLLTLSDAKFKVDYSNIKISKICLINKKDLALIDGNKAIYLYANKRIYWKIDLFLLFTSEYEGGIFYLDRKIYLDTPALVKESSDSEIISNTVLFRIDEDSGNLEYLVLPSDIKFKRFTTMFGSKIIDASGNVFDVRNNKLQHFPLKLYR
ncbi:hypothetical protein [Brachyspira catarrhinii]|uniref:WG repeat-containing protein n=1 Tax=Brachyspira catarrhinii TaxID=2528966 RepID=A0ABY2TNX3_9SPIR|nr:hypothetical protein [Brachyspira catarrhinii]TKZ31558.1 hypothetical protein EZH24_09760 [Brachyspira catarrhinii]